MAKKVINDIIPGKRSIRQIPISSSKKPIVNKIPETYREQFDIPKIRGNREPLNPKFVIWLIAIVALLALFFGVSLIFSSATLTIKPRLEKITLSNDTFTAKLDTAGLSGLSFEVLKLDKVDEVTVEATEEKIANQKASGKIIIYNNYSSASQRLINNTRFESTNGKIYRLNSSVDVPGTKIINGKTVPGSVEATVFADQPGDSYNLKLSDLEGDFKIPGFKGSPRYDSFYARLKTDIVGGLIGKQRIVSAEVRAEAIEKLKTNLKESLLKELYSIKPDNYIVFNNSYSIEYTDLPDSPEGEDKVKINLRGNLNSVVFNSVKLASYIAPKKLANFDSLPATFVFGDDLSVTFNAKDLANLWKNTAIEVKFTGPAYIRWSYDPDAIKKDLLGKPVSASVQALSKYKDQVESIKVNFSPVWTQYFPDNINRIKIKELDE